MIVNNSVTTCMPTLKIWKHDLQLIRSTKISYANKVFPVTCIACHGITQVAVGLENGIVILMRGDFTRDRSISARVVHEGSEVISGLGFRDDGTETQLFIVTHSHIYNCVVSSKEPAVSLDAISSTIGNSIITPQERNQEMAIADSQAVYFYGSEGRGPCFIIGGEKTGIFWFKGYLVVVSREASPLKSSSDPVSEASKRLSMHDQGPGTLLTIYDLKGKYIAFRDDFGLRIFNAHVSKAIGEPIKFLISENTELIIITAMNNVFRLREIDLTRKLELLYSKNMYTLAMNIILQPASLVYNVSKSRTVEDLVDSVIENPDNIARTTVMDACKRYADYLYSKTEYDASVKQYVRTIGHLQPSYVIRKFLDAQRISNLTSYLQALHKADYANANHTTLLLNCWTKLNDFDSLNAFISTSESFDIDSAIIVCRNAGFHQQALGIASKFEQHDWYLKIQIEDLELYEEAISYLGIVPPEMFQKTLLKYGQKMVSRLPQRMTKILLEYVGENYREVSISDIATFYIHWPEWCVLFLENLLNLLFEINLYGREVISVPKISNILNPKGDANILQPICDLMLDLQLDLRQSGKILPKMESVNWDDRIITLLNSPEVTYDLENALFLAQQYQFDRAILILYEKLNLFTEYLDKVNDFKSILETCQKYGNKHPELWRKGFGHCAKRCTSDEESAELIQMLDAISEKRILSDVEIIQLLAKCNVSLGSVRPYIMRKMEQSANSIKKAEQSVKLFREESLKYEGDIKNLKSRPVTFQASKCELCKQPLELPSFHFLCKHSFHSKCLGDMNQECPSCAPERHLMDDLVKTQIANSNNQELFERKINDNPNSFETIIEYFGKGMFLSR